MRTWERVVLVAALALAIAGWAYVLAGPVGTRPGRQEAPSLTCPPAGNASLGELTRDAVDLARAAIRAAMRQINEGAATADERN